MRGREIKSKEVKIRYLTDEVGEHFFELEFPEDTNILKIENALKTLEIDSEERKKIVDKGGLIVRRDAQNSHKLRVKAEFDLLTLLSLQRYSVSETLHFISNILRNNQFTHKFTDESISQPDKEMQDAILKFVDLSDEQIDKYLEEDKEKFRQDKNIPELLGKIAVELKILLKNLKESKERSFIDRGEIIDQFIDNLIKNVIEIKNINRDFLISKIIMGNSKVYSQVKAFLPYYALYGHETNRYGKDEKLPSLIDTAFLQPKVEEKPVEKKSTFAKLKKSLTLPKQKRKKPLSSSPSGVDSLVKSFSMIEPQKTEEQMDKRSQSIVQPKQEKTAVTEQPVPEREGKGKEKEKEKEEQEAVAEHSPLVVQQEELVVEPVTRKQEREHKKSVIESEKLTRTQKNEREKYELLWDKTDGSDYKKMQALLGEYSRGNSWIRLFVSGHWTRNHTKEVFNKMTKMTDKHESKTNVEEAKILLLDKLRKIPLENEKGTLNTIISVIENKLDVPHAERLLKNPPKKDPGAHHHGRKHKK